MTFDSKTKKKYPGVNFWMGWNGICDGRKPESIFKTQNHSMNHSVSSILWIR